MSVRLSDALFKMVLMAGAFACAVLLLRNGSAIGLHIPLDRAEGWNAYHALAAINGTDLYPPGWMVNNHPPLSFYLVGALGRSLGDIIIAGRLISLLSFIAITMALAGLMRQMGGRVLDGLFAALLFAAALLITSNHVAMNDPQLLGHALQLEALLLLLRERPVTALAAALMAAGLFVQHTLFVLPLAALAWLALQNRHEARRLALYGIGFCLLGLLAARSILDVNLLAAVTAPRLWSLAQWQAQMAQFLSWAALPLALVLGLGWRGRHDNWMRFCLLYTVLALAAGMALCAADGAGPSLFFDLDIAMALGAGLALSRLREPWRGVTVLACAMPLALFLARHAHDSGSAYSEALQRETRLDIAFLAIRPGPALCENLTLCFWANKDAPVDVFNISRQFRSGARSDESLAGLVRERHFRVIQLDSLDALGPKVRAAIDAHYRVTHVDDNGAFLVPDQAGARTVP